MKKLFALLILIPFFSCQQIEEKLEVVLHKEGELILKSGCGKNKDVLNTITGEYTKDMVRDAPITFPLKLSTKELDSIVAKAKEIDFESYPKEHIVNKKEARRLMIPCSTFSLTMFLNGKTKTVNWDDCAVEESRIDDVKKLEELIILISKMVQNTPEYKASPRPNGGYL